MNRIALSALLIGSLVLGALGCSATSGVRSPAVSFGASASDVSLSCTPDGSPHVIATRVIPREGVTAVAEGDRIEVRFGTTRTPHLEVALDPETLGVLGSESVATAPAPSASRGPVSVELPDHRHLVAWTEGSIEQGLRVHATTVTRDGSSEGAIDLGYEGSAIGEPAVAVTRAGNGVIAFIESNDAGYQVVVTHVSCATP